MIPDGAPGFKETHTPDIQSLKGVGKGRAALFARLGLCAAADLPAYYPRAYEDRSDLKMIAALEVGDAVCVRATVAGPVSGHRVRGGLELFKTRAFDETGMLSLTFFNAPYIQTALTQGQDYIFYGKVSADARGRPQMTNPACEPADRAGRSTGRILPCYRLTAGLTQGLMRGVMAQALERFLDGVEETLPRELRQRLGLRGARFAVGNIHFPQSDAALEQARRRLVFEELLILQLALARLKRRRRRREGLRLPPADLADFYAALPFSLTNDQQKAIADARDDMAGGYLMHRLIQGDVGSGKTLVAAACAVSVIRGGPDFQAALMAPTEILAEQHYATLRGLLAGLGIETALLTGRLTSAQKRKAREKIASGEARMIVGTHALLSEGVEFRSLALTITDEQHRFGVRQQTVLHSQASALQSAPPHRLVMSATPIPRTLALVLYGDMDVTVMRGLPPGRRPVKTYAVTEEMRPRIHAFIRRLAREGRQVYIVCPTIGDGETEMDAAGLAAAAEYAENLRDAVFPDLRVGLLHGRQTPKAKDAAMRAFAEGETQVLVSTTVIEVGVDVPNAALMVVENAERFGLSQLHQLRGRVGRGTEESYCVLFLQSRSETARQRLDVVCRNADGFAIAEADLALRGPGDFFGQRQHGLPEFRLADLSADMELVTLARNEAEALAGQEDFGALENAVGKMLETMGR